MAYNLKLAERIRKALPQSAKLEEKKMFRGISFMLNDKMCVSVSGNRLMCRIDPALHRQALEKKGTSSVVMRGKEYAGWVYVDEEGWKSDKDFNYWISLSLDFNQHAKSWKTTSAKRNS